MGPPPPAGGKGMRCFLAAAGGHQRGKTSHSAFAAALNFSHSSHRFAFFPPATKQTRSLHFHHLTHIQNRFLVGCCSRNQVQVFDPAPDRRVKACHSCVGVPRPHSSVKSGRRHAFSSSYYHSDSHIGHVINWLGFSVTTESRK